MIAHVLGKGVSATLFMERAMTVVGQYVNLGYSSAEILFHLNTALCQNNFEQMFAKAFIGMMIAHTFVYATSGHNPPYLLSKTFFTLEKK